MLKQNKMIINQNLNLRGMSNRDRVAKNQSGNSGEIPKLPIAVRLQMKENPATGNVAFAQWKKGENGEQGEYLYGEKPLKGLLIGSAMMLKVYDETIGRNGGTLFSAPYLTKENIVMFEPGATGLKKLVQGTKEVVEATILATHPKADRPSVSVLLYLFIPPTGKKAGGLYEIETNASIAFDGMKIHKNETADNYTVLVPTLYSTTDTSITGVAHQVLGKFAKKNPPKYAKITIAERIPDEVYDTDEVSQVLDAWDAWKDFVLAKKEVKDETNDDNTGSTAYVKDNAGSSQAQNDPRLDNRPGKAPKQMELEPEDEDSDLPF